MYYERLADHLDAWPTVGLGAILLLAASFAWPSLRAIWLARNLPGPTLIDLPLIGNFNKLMFRTPEEAFNRMREMYETYGSVVGFRIFHKILVGIVNPDDAQLVLMNSNVNNREMFAIRAITSYMEGGILALKDNEAANRRKLMTPAFHLKILATYLETFGRKSDELAKRLAGVADGRTVNINDHCSLCTLSTIFETAIGWRSEYGDDEIMNLNSLLHEAIRLTVVRVKNPLLWADWIYARTANGRRGKSVSEEINKFVDQHLAITFTTISKLLSKNAHTTKAEKKKIQSYSEIVIETALKEGNTCLPSYVRGDVVALIIGGSDSSASTMSYALILLGMHPEYQERVSEEQRAIFKDSLQQANIEDLTRMPFLELVIKETLRLFAPVSVMSREIPVDIPITHGYVVPAGSYAYINSHLIHRDVRNYVDPERFWPERWLAENSVGRHPYAFLPYAAGVRNCIGQKYAQLQMKATLSRLLRQFRFTSDYTMKELNRIEFGIVNRSAVGYNVKIYPRLFE